MARGGMRALQSEELRRPRTGSPKAVQAVLIDALKKFGLDKCIERYRFVQHWGEIVGEQIALRARPECLRNSTLVVRVTNSAWAQELAFQKEAILKRLERFLPEGEVVDDMQFYVGGQCFPSGGSAYGGGS